MELLANESISTLSADAEPAVSAAAKRIKSSSLAIGLVLICLMPAIHSGEWIGQLIDFVR